MCEFTSYKKKFYVISLRYILWGQIVYRALRYMLYAQNLIAWLLMHWYLGLENLAVGWPILYWEMPSEEHHTQKIHCIVSFEMNYFCFYCLHLF